MRRLGGASDIPVSARIVSATNRNVEDMVREGRFREDLYYRLNVFRISLLPLRERREDIPLLADHLLHKISHRMGRSVPALSAEALEKLLVYDFPGNIRELENILERALIYSDGPRLIAENIDLHRPGAAEALAHPPSGSSSGSLENLEKNAIRETLARYRGNRTKAAKELGVSRKTILNKIKAYELD